MHSSDRPSSRKRATRPRSCDFTKSFRKDWQRLSHSRRYDMKRLKEVMMLLVAHDAPLGPEWLDHALHGDWSDHGQCHVGGEFLLIYRIEGDSVVFVRASSHADLFDC